MRTLAQPRNLPRRSVRALLTQWPLALAGEVEGIHQARVASRRLRELVPAFASRRDPDAARRLRRGLREVTRLLGRSRELDVALETLQAVEARSPALEAPARLVRAHITRERAEAGRAAQARASLVRVDDLAAAIQVLAEATGPAAAVRGCARRVAGRLGRRAGELEQAVVAAGLIFAAGPLHAVRIAVKKFRYALEVAERLGRFRLAGTLRHLKDLQNLLGDIHDRQVLAGLARDAAAEIGGPARRAIDPLVDAIDRDIRSLHGRFLADREALIVLLTRATEVRRALTTLPPPARASRPGPRTRARRPPGRTLLSRRR